MSRWPAPSVKPAGVKLTPVIDGASRSARITSLGSPLRVNVFPALSVAAMVKVTVAELPAATMVLSITAGKLYAPPAPAVPGMEWPFTTSATVESFTPEVASLIEATTVSVWPVP